MRDNIKPPTLSTNFSERGKSAKKRVENILNTKTKKAGLLSFGLIICVVLVVGFMVGKSENTQRIETNYFSVSLPTAYEITNFFPESGTFKIYLDGRDAGYADIRSAAYYEVLKNAATPFFDNHSRTLSSEELSGFAMPVYKMLIEHTRPAAEMDDTVTTLEHYLFFNNEDGVMINLALNIELFTEKQRMELAKSVKLGADPIIK